MSTFYLYCYFYLKMTLRWNEMPFQFLCFRFNFFIYFRPQATTTTTTTTKNDEIIIDLIGLFSSWLLDWSLLLLIFVQIIFSISIYVFLTIMIMIMMRISRMSHRICCCNAISFLGILRVEQVFVELFY